MDFSNGLWYFFLCICFVLTNCEYKGIDFHLKNLSWPWNKDQRQWCSYWTMARSMLKSFCLKRFLPNIVKKNLQINRYKFRSVQQNNAYIIYLKKKLDFLPYQNPGKFRFILKKMKWPCNNIDDYFGSQRQGHQSMCHQLWPEPFVVQSTFKEISVYYSRNGVSIWKYFGFNNFLDDKWTVNVLTLCRIF